VEFHNVPEPEDNTEGANHKNLKIISSPKDTEPAQTEVRQVGICNKLFFRKRGHAKALLSKNFYRIVRHPG